jgi:hypothetical protein
VEGNLREVCASLLKYDNGIVEIVQFGSSIYAPQLAKDIDSICVISTMAITQRYNGLVKRGE